MRYAKRVPAANVVSTTTTSSERAKPFKVVCKENISLSHIANAKEGNCKIVLVVKTNERENFVSH